MAKSLLEFLHFRSRKSANTAKERLQIVVSHQRVEGTIDSDILTKLRHELILVISKYIKIDEDQVNVQLQKDGSISVLELNVVLPTVS